MIKFIILLILGSIFRFILCGNCTIHFTFPGLSNVKVTLYDPELFEILRTESGNEGITFTNVPTTTFNKIYALISYKGIFKPVYDIPCFDEGFFEVNDITGILRVLFPGLKADYVRVLPNMGSERFVWSLNNAVDSAEFKVIKGVPYLVRIKSGPTYAERSITIIDDIHTLNNFTCQITVPNNGITQVTIRTVNQELVMELVPETEDDLKIPVLKNFYSVEVISNSGTNTFVTNCTTNASDNPVEVSSPSEMCSVNIELSDLIVDNITIVDSNDNSIYSKQDVRKSVTLDALDASLQYKLYAYYKGCPVVTEFNCSTTIIRLNATITISFINIQKMDIEVLCNSNNNLIREFRGDQREDIVFSVLKDVYKLRFIKDYKDKFFYADTRIGNRAFIYSDDYLFPLNEEGEITDELIG